MQLAFEIVHSLKATNQYLAPMIFLHGMLDSKRTWDVIIHDVARLTGRKAFVYDARNHGESPWASRFDFDVLAEDLDKFMLQRNIPKAVLVGHSMGGRTALTLALKKPEKVEMLVVEDMTPKNFSPRSSNLIVALIEMLRSSLEVIPPDADETAAKLAVGKYIKSLIPESSMKSKESSSSEKKQDELFSADGKLTLNMIPLKKTENGFAWQANLDVIEDMLTTDKIKQDLSGVYNGHALFLYGTKSFFKVKEDTLIPKYFPNAIKLGFEGASHLIHHEFPKKFVLEVSKFINERTPSNSRAKY